MRSDAGLFLLDYDELASRTDFNQSTQTAADAAQPDYRSKSEGSACTDDRFCKSGVCVPKLGSRDGSEPDGVCVLDEFAEFAPSSYIHSSPWQHDYYHALASSAFFRPMWASLCVAATGFVPMQWGDRQLNRPAIQSTVGAGAVLFGARAWIAWSMFPEGWLTSEFEQNSLRSIYMTLIDCSDFSQEETVGMKAFASGYFCYKAPKIQSSAPSQHSDTTATFHVQSGGTGCHTAQSGQCVQSPNYPGGDYNDNDHCDITISGSASLSATHFETEGASYDYIKIGSNSHKYGGSWDAPTNVHVTSDTVVTWRTDSSSTRSGWELCLSPCDSTCQSRPVNTGGSSPSGPDDSGNRLPQQVSDNMATTITGIASSPSEDYIVNPVLVSFVHSCAAWEVGLFFSVLSGFLSTFFAFPITCAGFCGAADLVLCCGRCCSVDVKPADGGPKDATPDSSAVDALANGGAPVAPVTTIKAPASMTAEPQPEPHLAPADYITEPSVTDVLATCGLSQYHESLTALGVNSVDDLKELDEKDFEREAGMKRVEVKRLIRHLRPQDGSE